MNGAKYKGRNLTVEFSVPKGSYEKRIDSIVEHTHMQRKDAIQPMSLKLEKKKEAKEKEEADKVPVVPKTKTQERREARERKAKEREDQARAEAKASVTKVEEKKAFAETAKPKKAESQRDTDCTLFVRNIGWDVDQNEFREFMEGFGEVKYAVLCKTRGDLLEAVDGTNAEQPSSHKGTGFVRFANEEEAQALL